MTDRNPNPIGPRFEAYRRAVSADVRPPGVEAVHRTVHHRQRRRTVVATVAALVVTVVWLAQLALDERPGPVPVGPGPSPTGSAPATRSLTVVDGADLRVVGPGTATLQPAGETYRGVVNIDVYNLGRQPYTITEIYFTLPEGVAWDATDSPMIGGCGGSPAAWTCPASPVPASGGHVRLPIRLVANIAPGAEPMTLDGFTIRITGRNAQGAIVADLTPEDNEAAVRLLLAPG